MLTGSTKCHQLAIHWLTNPILTFVLLFIVVPIISPISFKTLQNMTKKEWTLIWLQYHTTIMAGQHDWACKHHQCACALAIIDWLGNDKHLGTWTYCECVDGLNYQLAGCQWGMIVIQAYKSSELTSWGWIWQSQRV